MKVRVKLMGMLKDRTPDAGFLEVPAATTVAELLETLHVDSRGIQVVTVNGSVERDRQRELTDNDEVIVLPPVGGG